MKLFLRATMLGLAIGGIVPASPAQESKAQPLKPNQLELLLSGNTLHLKIGENGSAMVFFDQHGQARAVMPNGSRDSGIWSFQSADTYCVNWEKGPKNSCTTVLWTPGLISLIDAEGKPRGVIVRIAPGQDAALQP